MPFRLILVFNFQFSILNLNMDIGTLIGFAFGIVLITVSILLGGSESLGLFWNVPSLLIVFGGAVCALLIAFPIKSVFKTFTFVRLCFARQESAPQEIVKQIVAFSEIARREGLLSLESRLEKLDDPFFAEGLRLTVDGTTPAMVETVLMAEINAVNLRHQHGRSLILNYGKYTPAFGMIGTLIGLVLMLTRLNAETVGPGMAVAVLTTLYGALASNLFFLPIAEKLGQLNAEELRMKEMILKGILAIQAGEHPRMIQYKLSTYLPPENQLDEYMPNNDAVEENAETIVLTEEKIAA
ncbi:flagellar motor protein MotP [Planctomycetales bacterium]|nr:flagellar motor protein MotP [Planctomycetales bacterium]